MPNFQMEYNPWKDATDSASKTIANIGSRLKSIPQAKAYLQQQVALQQLRKAQAAQAAAGAQAQQAHAALYEAQRDKAVADVAEGKSIGEAAEQVRKGVAENYMRTHPNAMQQGLGPRAVDSPDEISNRANTLGSLAYGQMMQKKSNIGSETAQMQNTMEIPAGDSIATFAAGTRRPVGLNQFVGAGATPGYSVRAGQEITGPDGTTMVRPQTQVLNPGQQIAANVVGSQNTFQRQGTGRSFDEAMDLEEYRGAVRAKTAASSGLGGIADLVDPSKVRANIDARRAAAKSGTKVLNKDQAKAFLEKAGGDTAKARQLAKEAGFEF